jgi:hypothetical protein
MQVVAACHMVSKVHVKKSFSNSSGNIPRVSCFSPTSDSVTSTDGSGEIEDIYFLLKFI